MDGDERKRPTWTIAGRVYRGTAGDVVMARSAAWLLVLHERTDGIWRNVSLYDLRPGDARKGGWRRFDLGWHTHRRVWARGKHLLLAETWVPEGLAWAASEVEGVPKRLPERITEAERVVGGMTQGGELSAALVRSAALERPLGGIRQKKRGDTYGEE